jgi:hypothetical protein
MPSVAQAVREECRTPDSSRPTRGDRYQGQKKIPRCPHEDSVLISEYAGVVRVTLPRSHLLRVRRPGPEESIMSTSVKGEGSGRSM